jgi:hypothetical protein
MATPNMILTMNIIIILALGSGLALFYFSASAAQKKTNKLYRKLKISGKPSLDVAASSIL